MKKNQTLRILVGVGLSFGSVFADQADAPYKVLATTQVMGTGGIDYVYADSDGRRAYVPRGGQTFAFDLDTHQLVGTLAGLGGRGVAVDPKTHHGFNSSKPLGMFDTQTLLKIKDIEVQGNPDGIFFEPLTQRIYVFSHAAPNVTVLDPKDGSSIGTIDLGGAPEQAQSDGQGHLYVAIEDRDNIAVVDVRTLKVTAHHGLQGKGGGPAGLGLDARNHILFAMCHEPATCVILNAEDGKLLATLPIGKGTDGGGFNPRTMEAFSSQRDGTLTIIKESSPTSFAVTQTVATKAGCKTCSLDTKNNNIVLICTERAPQAAGTTTPGTDGGGRGGRGGPGNLDVLFVGR